jgi:hypothetical protein
MLATGNKNLKGQEENSQRNAKEKRFVGARKRERKGRGF